MGAKGEKEEKKVSIEEGLERLENILREMDEPDIELEESFKLFEEGMKLLQKVNVQIDAVEKRVKQLTEDGGLTDFEEE